MLRAIHPFRYPCTACGEVVAVPISFSPEGTSRTCQCGLCHHWMVIEVGRLRDLTKDEVALAWEEPYRAHVLESMAETEKKYWG